MYSCNSPLALSVRRSFSVGGCIEWVRGKKVIFCSFIVLCAAATGLMANSSCLTDRGGAYGTQIVSIRRVYCACPCDQFPHDEKRDMCLRCEHYHADRGNSFMPVCWKSMEPWKVLGLE